MNTKQRKDLDLTLALTLQMQSILHTLDELSHEVSYKREFKQRCENFYTWVEKIVEPTTKTLPDDGRYKWADIVNEIDKIVQKIKLFEDEK
jgi:hypothetical protein